MKLRNGAHVDRMLDINPAATSAIAQQNASSPLLRLPLEVKNLIYKYTFGGHLIHIIQNPDKGAAKFKNTICRASISEEKAQENFDSESTNQWYAPANEGRHDCCRFHNRATIRDRKKRPKVLSLRLLRCCRQMYNEAHHTPYSTNTFSCADPETLRSFVVSLARRNDDNHLAVRSLFIEMKFCDFPNHNQWKKALSTCTTRLKNLQNVDISFEWCRSSWMWGPGSPADSEVKSPKCADPLMSGIFMLEKLPLKSATIVISDAQIWSVGITRRRWTLAEKQEWARDIKKIILK